MRPVWMKALFGLTLGLALAGCSPKPAMLPVKTSGGEVQLESYVFRPAIAGKYPVVIFNHGSAAGDPKTSLTFETQAKQFIEKGYIFVSLMRRGRGQSEGVSRESEVKNCDAGAWDTGLSDAFDDLTAAIDYLKTLQFVDTKNFILAGTSRGGFLSVAYAAKGARKDDVTAVINFAGGWVAQAEDKCPSDFNATSFAQYGAQTKIPMLWLYGAKDRFYGDAAPVAYADAFQKAGGNAEFKLIDNVPVNGHFLAENPDLWRDPTYAFLARLPKRK